MDLQHELTSTMCEGETSGKFAVTAILREYEEDGTKYYVAECLEIPGCVSQGDTEEEARQNFGQALDLCLSVVFEDALKKAMRCHPVPDLRNISSQRKLNVETTHHLQYA